MVPALANIGAMRRFADGMEIQTARQLFQVVKGLAHRCARLQPIRLGLGPLRRNVDLDQLWKGSHGELSIVPARMRWHETEETACAAPRLLIMNDDNKKHRNQKEGHRNEKEPELLARLRAHARQKAGTKGSCHRIPGEHNAATQKFTAADKLDKQGKLNTNR